MKSMPDTCPAPITGIDSHAHVFSRELNLAAARRYTPGYDATLAQYLKQKKMRNDQSLDLRLVRGPDSINGNHEHF